MHDRHKYILKRLTLTAFALWVVITILFLMFRLLPGDPGTSMVALDMPQEVRQRIRMRFGLTEPLYVQYYKYMINLVQGDLGISFRYMTPVTNLLIDKTLNTLALTMTSMMLAFIVGPLIGAFLAWNRGTSTDTMGILLTLVFRSMPAFWVGMIALMIFSFQLGWFPTGGMRSASYSSQGALFARYLSADFLWHLALPLTVSTLYYISLPVFIMRNSMIEILGADFIQLARAQGIPEHRILFGHAARNSLLPVVHLAAVALGFAFGGSVIIETIFSWPGVGRLMWTAVTEQDYPLAQGAFLMLSTVIMTMNFFADVISVYIDPRATGGE